MIELCREAGLPEPSFELRQGSFVLTLWRDWLTEEVKIPVDLNERQLAAVAHVKTEGRITSAEYQQLTGSTARTATRDLDDLVQRGILLRVGVKRGTYYILSGG